MTENKNMPGRGAVSGEFGAQARVRGRGLGSPRNGLPLGKPYVYRGTGRDVMPGAHLDPAELEAAAELEAGKLTAAELEAGADDETRGRKMTYGAKRCDRCGRDWRSKAHKRACGPADA